MRNCQVHLNMNYEIYIEESSIVRVLNTVIDEIYSKEDYTIQSKWNGAVPEDIMMKILVYGYMNDSYSSRNDYIPMPLTEQRKEGTELKFYLSLFRKFYILDTDTAGLAYFWNTYFTCRLNDHVFRMIYDNEYDIVSFAVDEKCIEQREFIAESIRTLVEKEGPKIEIVPQFGIIDLNSDLVQ